MSCFFIRLHTYNIITSCFYSYYHDCYHYYFFYIYRSKSSYIIIPSFHLTFLESNFYCRIVVVFFCLFNPYLILLQMGPPPLGQSITFISMDFFCFHHYCHKISLSIFPLLYILVVFILFLFVLLFFYISTFYPLEIYIYTYIYIYIFTSYYHCIYLFTYHFTIIINKTTSNLLKLIEF